MEPTLTRAVADALDLAGVRDALLALPHPYRREDVHRVVSRLRVRPADLEPWQNWRDDRYTRTRFHQGERFEILVLCWQDGQESPIHDHADSICTMAVIEGDAVTTMYHVGEEAGQPALVREASTVLREGSVTTVFGGDIHRVGNPAGSGHRLVTVHIYLPPIPEMLVWDEGDPTPRRLKAVTLDPRA